jgi:chromosomal replication initiation ATPase DnaA
VSAARQLPLPFAHVPHFATADFLPAPSNAAALAWLERGEAWPQGRLALWGPPGSGKTHLLHVWAARTGAAILPGHALRFRPFAGPLAIDDADTAPELALLHLLNAAAEAGLPALLTGRAPPARWTTALPDLASRLRAVNVVEIAAPEEALLRILLARLLAERQLAVPEAVQEWLLLRLPRTPAAIREVAARLDHAALAAGGRASRMMAARVLADMQEADIKAGDTQGLADAADLVNDEDGHEDFKQPPSPFGAAAARLL